MEKFILMSDKVPISLVNVILNLSCHMRIHTKWLPYTLVLLFTAICVLNYYSQTHYRGIAFERPTLFFVTGGNKESISSTFFTRLFCTKAFFPFSSYVLGLNELLYEKRGRKTLMKLSQGVNVINVKRENFSFWQLFSSYMYIVKAAKTKFVWKICTFNDDEID